LMVRIGRNDCTNKWMTILSGAALWAFTVNSFARINLSLMKGAHMHHLTRNVWLAVCMHYNAGICCMHALQRGYIHLYTHMFLVLRHTRHGLVVSTRLKTCDGCAKLPARRQQFLFSAWSSTATFSLRAVHGAHTHRPRRILIV
jgi:hypothetical protein